VAGTIDIGSAYLINGRSIPFILQTIAGGLLGQETYSGGSTTVIVGAVLQELMGIAIAAIYVVGCRLLPTLTEKWVAISLVYGGVIFLVMNYVVLPLSAWKYWPHFSAVAFTENLLAMLLFGLIIGYFARRWGSR
jgi:hypothetical protein